VRVPEYLSYNSFKLFETDPDAFYRKYITEKRQPREPQNYYMAIGSAFDAFVKADLHKRFVNDGNPKYTADALFETQVESQNRDRAKIDGTELYKRYIKVGALNDLVADMKGCINPRFESDVTATLSIGRLDGGVNLLGKPDVNYIHRDGARVVHDFKCQGFYSANPPSPSQGYVRMMSLGKDHMTMHKNAMLRNHKGIMINGNSPLNLHCEDWATQLTFYAWSLGESVGSDYVLSVDQILSDSKKGTTRVAKHAGICTDVWQNKLFDRLHKAWHAILNGHIFMGMGYEDSQRRCEAIEIELASQPDSLFQDMTRGKMRIR
jgi:hypothetical protein